MGCFSYLCTECGAPINSTSFNGENVRLSLLENGKVIEEMQGAYDSYGRVFSSEKNLTDKSMTATSSFEWESKDWGDIVDMHFDGNPKNGISAAHVHCIKKNPNYKPVQASEDDPDQGWGRIKSFHRGNCEVFHRIITEADPITPAEKKEFKVSLEITLSAENPLEAAKLARQWAIEDPMIYVTQNQETGEIHTVDLSEEDEAAVLPTNDYQPYITKK